MSATTPVPIERPPARNRSLSSPAKRTHELASSDASVGREPDRERDRECLAGWSSC